MPGGKRTGAGRRKGVPNKVTQTVREAIGVFAQANVESMQVWLSQVAETDPKAALDLYLKALEYHVPKLGRVEQTGLDGGAQEHVFRWEK